MATKVWNNASGADWTTAGNWTPTGQPGTADDVMIAQSAARIGTDVGFVQSVTLSDRGSLSLFQGALSTASLQASGTLTFQVTANSTLATTSLAIAGTASLEILNSTVRSTDFINAGKTSFSNGGTLDVAGTFTNNGSVSSMSSGSATVIQVKDLVNAGSIKFDTSGNRPASLVVSGQASGAGIISTYASGTVRPLVEFGGASSVDVAFSSYNPARNGSLLQFDKPSAGYTGHVTGFSASDILDLKEQIAGYTYDGTTLTVTPADGGPQQSFAISGSVSSLTMSSDGSGGTQFSAVCYASGTLIRTMTGDVAVEALRSGDLVVTASGAHRPIRWLGHRVVDCRRPPRPHEVMPVRIAAHAFGENRPARDLRVSPGHAICVDVLGEVLIPAASLINGSTIVQEPVDTVTYWHVELDSHDVILAENLACESYLEMGNRSFFGGGAVVALDASPDAPVPTHADFCRPFHADGALVAFVRERLALRAANLGWTLEHGPSADLHLVVDGRRIDAETSGLQVRFLVPAGAEEVWLVSDTGVPAEVGIGPDRRALGVCIGGLVVDDGFACLTISADDPSLCVGFHDIEAGPQRWTCGRARLPAVLWDGCRGSFFVRVDLTRPALPRWAPPAVVRQKEDPIAVGSIASSQNLSA